MTYHFYRKISDEEKENLLENFAPLWPTQAIREAQYVLVSEKFDAKTFFSSRIFSEAQDRELDTCSVVQHAAQIESLNEDGSCFERTHRRVASISYKLQASLNSKVT